MRSFREHFRVQATLVPRGIDSVTFALAALPGPTDLFRWREALAPGETRTAERLIHDSGWALPTILWGSDIRLLTPDGSRIFDGWRLRDAAGATIATIDSKDEFVSASADGSRFLTKTSRGDPEFPNPNPTGRLWDTATGVVLAEMPAEIVVGFSDDAHQHSLITKGLSLELRDGKTGALIAELGRDELARVVDQPLFFASGDRFLTLLNRSIKLRDSNTGRVVTTLGDVEVFLGPPAAQVFGVVSHKGNRRTYSLHDARNGSIVSLLETEASGASLFFRGITFTPGGRLVVGANKRVAVHDAVNGRRLFELPAGTDWLASGDGARIVTVPAAGENPQPASGAATQAQLRDGATGAAITDLGQLAGSLPQSVTFSADGSRIAIVDASRRVVIRDGHAGTVIAALGPLRPDPTPLSFPHTFSADSRRIALVSAEKTAIHDTHTGDMVAEFAGSQHANFIRPDLVVTTEADGTSSLWDPERGTRVAYLGFPGSVRSVGNQGWIQTENLLQRVEPVAELSGASLREYVCLHNAREIGSFSPDPSDNRQRERDASNRLFGLPWNPCDWQGLLSVEGWLQLTRYWGARVGLMSDYLPGEDRAFGSRHRSAMGINGQ